jgi:hypothetical protein
VTYLGLELLEVLHNMRDPIAEAFGRQGDLLDNPTGRRVFDDHAGIPLPERSFSWTADGRAAVVALRTFLDAREGRRVPFWVPTCCWDLQLAEDGLAASQEILILRTGYGRFLYTSASRQHLALFPPGDAAPLLRQVLDVVENGDGTETLQLDAQLGADLPASTTMISFLVLCRLAEDLVRISYWGTALANAELPFRELPHEVPS